MKVFSILLFFFPLSLIAQSPMAFNYQGIARDGQGEVYANQEISLELSLVRNSDAGPVDFTEEQFITTNDFGLFTVQIGKGDPVTGNLDALDWSTNQYFISVAFDPTGGRNFAPLGVTQLLSVPYAMHAKTASNASGASSDDQVLDLNGSLLTIEDGNSIDLGMLSGSTQTLAITGNELSISGGNTINLPDANPQTLAIDGSTLSISTGNSVTLPSPTGGSVWTESGNQISYTNGPVLLNDLQLRSNAGLSGRLFQSADGSGRLQLFASSGNSFLTFSGSTSGFGYVGVDNPATVQNLVRMSGSSSAGGFVGTYGPNASSNITLTNWATNADHGFMAVHDANNEIQASLFVNTNGQGVVNADITTTSASHPGRSSHDIVYAGLSGSEVGIYQRGQTQLVEGRAEVKLPDHFRLMADSSSYTITMTPYSIQSKGMGVVRKTKFGFIVGELFNGTGNYRIDWEVKAVRKGYENFPVIQEKKNSGSPEKKAN